MLSQLVCILDNKLSRQPIMQLLNFIFIILIKKKSLRIVFFQSQKFQQCFLFRGFKLLKSYHKTLLENFIFNSKFLKGFLLSVLKN